MAREAHRKTQNSTIKTAGDHNDVTIDYYGTISDIIVLSYTKNSKEDRSVILLRCEWYNLEGRTYQMKDGGYFKSINIEGRWYKNDPFILATEASQVFFLEDTNLAHLGEWYKNLATDIYLMLKSPTENNQSMNKYR